MDLAEVCERLRIEHRRQRLVSLKGRALTLDDSSAFTADAVLLASGTATLEAALLKRPMVVAYRMGALSWLLLSKLVRTEYVALPNILAGKALVPELLQGEATTAALLSALAPLLAGPDGVQGDTLDAFDAMHRELRRDCAVETATALLDLVATRRRGNAGSV